MENQKLNLFIVDDNKTMVTALKLYLQNRFGLSIAVTTFSDGESCLEKVDQNTNVVILDYFMPGKNGMEILRSIKVINPQTEVIMLSNNEDMATVIESFKEGAKDYLVKGPGSWTAITKYVNYIITEPIRLIVREFSVPKYLAIFLMTFVTIGVVVLLGLRFIK